MIVMILIENLEVLVHGLNSKVLVKYSDDDFYAFISPLELSQLSNSSFCNWQFIVNNKS